MRQLQNNVNFFIPVELHTAMGFLSLTKTERRISEPGRTFRELLVDLCSIVSIICVITFLAIDLGQRQLVIFFTFCFKKEFSHDQHKQLPLYGNSPRVKLNLFEPTFS